MKKLDLTSAVDMRLTRQLGWNRESPVRRIPVEFVADNIPAKAEVPIRLAQPEPPANQLRLLWLAAETTRSATSCHWGINE